MTFTFKLSRRLSQCHVAAVATMVLFGASCAPGHPLEGGLEPPPDEVVAIHLFPDSVSLNQNEFVDFTAVAELSSGGNGVVSVSWQAQGGTISAQGRYTAGSTAGNYRVIGVYQSGLADTSIVTVNPPPANPVLVRINVTPVTVALLPGASQQFAASGAMSDGSTTSVSVDWTATAGSITSGGNYAAPTTAGDYLVIATLQGGSLKDTALVSVSVPPATLEAVVLTPPSASLQFGQSQQFTAIGRLTDGSSANIAITWTATGGTVSAGGRYTAGNTAGTFRVIARSANGLADTSSIAVSAPTVSAITLTPATVSLQSGQTQQFSVSATLSNGTTQSNPAVTWSATGGSINGSGLFTAGATAGTFRVIAASSNGRADTSAVTISTPTVTAIVLTPATTTLAASQTRQFSVSATLSNGTTQANPTVSWSATGGTVSSGGLYTAGTTAGTFRVIAASPSGPADTSTVTISAATVTAIILTPPNATLNAGQTQQFSASATMSDGTTQSNPSVTWSATGGTVSTAGLYTAGSTAGTFRVIASASGRADTSAITISAATVTAVTVTPASVNLTSGQTQQFAASATLSNGTTQTNPSVTWTATGGTVTTAGLYTAGSTGGSFRVIAASSAGPADTSTITVTALTVTALTVTPASANLSIGQTRQFSATATLSNGSSQTNPTVSWSATGGTISSAGLYTAGAVAGTFRVIGASPSGPADTSAIAITVPTLISCALSPLSVSLAPGGTQQYSVSGSFSDGTVAAVQVSYSATGGTISNSGLYTAGSATGTYQVLAAVVASTISCSGSASIDSVSGPNLAVVTELPAGYTLRSSHTGSPLVPSGWLTNSDGTRNVTVVDDNQAPVSPTPVMRVTYPSGMGDGAGPVGMEYPGTNGASRLFFTYWFKYSSNFQGHDSQVNKHIFVFGANGSVLLYSEMRFVGNAASGNMDFQFQGGMAAPTYDKRLVDNYGGNHLSILKDRWHRVSVEMIQSGAGAGTVRAWVDGTKVGEITNANFATGIGVVKLDPTWGGNSGDVMNSTGYLYFDEVRFYTQ